MHAILILSAAAVTLVDFVFIFSCPWVNLIRIDETRMSLARVFLGWGGISMIVGALCLLLPISMLVDYSRLAPDSRFHSSSAWWQIFAFAINFAFPAFPLVLGYILRRFSREVGRD